MDSTLHYTSVSHADTMMSNINKMRLNADLCDVTVIIGNFRIMAHRIILSASAPFFFQSLQGEDRSNCLSECYLDGVDEAAALKIIEFCYTSAISLDEDSVWQLLRAALKFQLREIACLCCEFLNSGLDVATCVHIHEMAVKIRCSELVDTTTQFIQDNVDKVSVSPRLLQLPQEEMLTLTLSLQASCLPDHCLTRLLRAWLSHQNSQARSGLPFVQDLPHLQDALADFCPVGKCITEPGPEEQSYAPSYSYSLVCQKDEDGTVRSANTRQKSWPIENDSHAHKFTATKEMSMDSVSVEEIDSDRQQHHPAVTSGIPIHICVSCGEEFETETFLKTHQEECEESAHPHPSTRASGLEHQSRNCDIETNHSCKSAKDESLRQKREMLRLGDPADDLQGPQFHKEGDDHVVPSHVVANGVLSVCENGCKTEVDKCDTVVAKCQAKEGDRGVDERICEAIENNEYTESSTFTAEENKPLALCGNDTNNNDINESDEGHHECRDENIDVVNDNPSYSDGNEFKKEVNGGNQCPQGNEQQQSVTNVSESKPYKSMSKKASVISAQSMLRYKCQICSRSFVEGKSLAKHWKQVHGVDQSQASSAERGEESGGGIDSRGFLPVNRRRAGDVGQGECSSKQMKLDASDAKDMLSESSSTGLARSANTSELFNKYMHQYREFTKWCIEQGPLYCQLCLLYHPHGTVCPRATSAAKDNGWLIPGEAAAQENGDGVRRSLLPANSDIRDSSDTLKEDGEEGPLDMSKGSSKEFSSSYQSQISAGKSSSSNVSPISAPTLDLAQYYNNYAHLMAASVDNSEGTSTQAGPTFQMRALDLSNDSVNSLYNHYISYPNSPPTSYALNLTHEKIPQAAERSNDSGTVSRTNNMPSSSNQRSRKNASGAGNSKPGTQRRKYSSRQGFPCTVCSRVFSYQAALFTHMRSHSPTVRTYQCQLCQETFARAPDLKVHVCPNGIEKPYICPSCGQTFAKNIHLKRHLATHSGLKPYPCWVCGKRFSRSDHLKRHSQSIHAGSRPHACSICGKEFVRKYELNKHMLVHNISGSESALV